MKQTRDSITEVSVFLERLIAEPPEGRGDSALHLVSVFGGDQEVGAVIAAAQEGFRFQVEWSGRQITGTLGEKSTVYRASIQVPERKRPVRHAVLLSAAMAETTLGANAEARRTVLYDGSAEFVLHRLSVRFGLPALPHWADWFREELDRRGLVEALAGVNCDPIAVKGTKLRLLRILGQGVRRGSITIPSAAGNSSELGSSRSA